MVGMIKGHIGVIREYGRRQEEQEKKYLYGYNGGANSVISTCQRHLPHSSIPPPAMHGPGTSIHYVSVIQFKSIPHYPEFGRKASQASPQWSHAPSSKYLSGCHFLLLCISFILDSS